MYDVYIICIRIANKVVRFPFSDETVLSIFLKKKTNRPLLYLINKHTYTQAGYNTVYTIIHIYTV